MSPSNPPYDGVAVALLVHDRPDAALRLTRALAPLACYVHVDATAPAEVARTIAAGAGEHVRLLPRIGAGWAHPGVLQAEVAAYRTILHETAVEHVVLLTGADYPLVGPERLADFLAAHRGTSFVNFFRVPSRGWGRTGGWDRFLVRHAVAGKRRVVKGVRPLPRGLRPTGGSQSKVLARAHIAALLSALDSRPDVWAFFQEVWTPDETCLPTVLASPALGGTYPQGYAETLFHIDWSEGGKHPRTLGEPDLDLLRRLPEGVTPRFFARKFPAGDPVLDRLDEQLRTPAGAVAH